MVRVPKKGAAEGVRRVLKDGLGKVEQKARELADKYLSGELRLEEYVKERVRVELEREERVESNLRRLSSSRRRAH